MSALQDLSTFSCGQGVDPVGKTDPPFQACVKPRGFTAGYTAVFHTVILAGSSVFTGPETSFQHIHSPYYEYDGFNYLYIHMRPRKAEERSYTHHEVYL